MIGKLRVLTYFWGYLKRGPSLFRTLISDIMDVSGSSLLYAVSVIGSIARHVHENFKFLCFQQNWCQIERYCDSLQNEGSTTWNGEETVKLWVKNESCTIPRNCDLALPIDLCTILCVKAHFFTTKEHLTKMRFCFLKFGCYLIETLNRENVSFRDRDLKR